MLRVLLALLLLVGPLLACGEDSPTAPTIVEPDRDDDNTDDENENQDPDPPVSTGPPFSGTVFISPEVITRTDQTRFRDVAPAGQGERRVFDRRDGAWATKVVRLFDVRYAGRGSAVEFQVNLEFSQQAAREEVDFYAAALGRVPAVLLARIVDVEIHAGNRPFGGNGTTGTVHIHTGDSEARSSYLEEALFHEASHVALDPEHAMAPGWRAAQQADGEFISTYARDHPDREDVAETALAWWAVRHRPGRLSSSVRDVIERTIPNRMAYLDREW